MEIRRLRTLTLESFKTLSNLNPNFMKYIFYFSSHSTHRNHDICVHSRMASNYGDRSFRALRRYTWNSLPENIKSTTSYPLIKILPKVDSSLNVNVSCHCTKNEVFHYGFLQ